MKLEVPFQKILETIKKNCFLVKKLVWVFEKQTFSNNF